MTIEYGLNSILGEALHAALDRLDGELQAGLALPESFTKERIAHALGFAGWTEMCDRAISATSRDMDARLTLLVDRALDGLLVDNLADAFGARAGDMHNVVRELRNPHRALAPQGCC